MWTRSKSRTLSILQLSFQRMIHYIANIEGLKVLQILSITKKLKADFVIDLMLISPNNDLDICIVFKTGLNLTLIASYSQSLLERASQCPDFWRNIRRRNCLM